MNILVIGANGKAGHRIVEKALKAGHQVTGVVRREGAIEGIRTIVKDALQLKKQELTQFDVVVNATSAFTPDTYHLPADLTLLLVKALANTNLVVNALQPYKTKLYKNCLYNKYKQFFYCLLCFKIWF